MKFSIANLWLAWCLILSHALMYRNTRANIFFCGWQSLGTVLILTFGCVCMTWLFLAPSYTYTLCVGHYTQTNITISLHLVLAMDPPFSVIIKHIVVHFRQHKCSFEWNKCYTKKIFIFLLSTDVFLCWSYYIITNVCPYVRFKGKYNFLGP